MRVSKINSKFLKAYWQIPSFFVLFKSFYQNMHMYKKLGDISYLNKMYYRVEKRNISNQIFVWFRRNFYQSMLSQWKQCHLEYDMQGITYIKN